MPLTEPGLWRMFGIKLLMRTNYGNTNNPISRDKILFRYGRNGRKAITACTVKPNATITAAGHGAKTGDFIKITHLGSLDGYYPVKSATADKITLADEVNWSGSDQPTDFTNAKVSIVRWSSNFCAIKQIEGDGDTLTEEDITTMCSEGTETEAGEIEYGSIKLTFFYAPKTEMQQDLRKNSTQKKPSRG
ncbi:Uncharacterised protein [Rodentibacter pneumotropicus]|uniref:Uncharacterized protein n=1 Tax=Rodentibacter pneumotropicus TaxID=758 RepID=A0A448MNG3_9PAST|nr:Uncharacterised protein [Rodentibacter pneumotropicus]